MVTSKDQNILVYGAKHKKESIQFSVVQTLLMLKINTSCYKIFTFLVWHSQITAEQTNDRV